MTGLTTCEDIMNLLCTMYTFIEFDLICIYNSFPPALLRVHKVRFDNRWWIELQANMHLGKLQKGSGGTIVYIL